MCSITFTFQRFTNDVAKFKFFKKTVEYWLEMLYFTFYYMQMIVLLADNEADLLDMIVTPQTFCDQSVRKVNISKAKWMISEKSLVLRLETY